MDINKAIIVGRLTRDPESRTTPSGITVTSFAVATNFVWNDQSGNKKESVEYHNVVAWRKLGEIVAQYLRKGSRVLVEGRIQTRSWDGQDGTKKYRTEIIADNLIMLDGRNTGENQVRKPVEEQAEFPVNQNTPAPTPPPAEEEISVDDIPF